MIGRTQKGKKHGNKDDSRRVGDNLHGGATCRFCVLGGRPDQFALHRAEFAKYHRQITGKDAPEGMVNFAINPKVSKSGRDAYRIVSCGDNAQVARCTSGTGCQPVQVTITGSNTRSVWYGLYDLLERRGGCHWFWDGDVVPKRDAIDIVRMVLDRLIVLKIDELGSAVVAWRGNEKCKVESVKCKVVDEELVARARELAALFDRLADVLELHTDYSLWESYQRLDAIERIQNPDFTKTLFENAVNAYCLSHQYEAIRYVVAPAMAELAERIAKAVSSGDRKAGFSVHPRFGAIRKAAKAKPLASLKPTQPRTKENFRKVFRDLLKP